MKTISITEQQDIVGFTNQNASEGEQVAVLTRDFLTSNESRFYTYVRNISGLFLYPHNVVVDKVNQFLVVIHANRTVDLYMNDEVTVVLNVSVKRDAVVGQVMYHDNIADVRRMRFRGIAFTPADKVIYCFKVGWKFALFFDLDRVDRFDVDQMEFILGDLYRSLSFEAVYDTLAIGSLSDAIFKDGWFPFLELLEDPFHRLATAYKENHGIASTIEGIVDEFTPERLQNITERWWRNPVIAAHKAILEAGVKAFVAGDEPGHIACIKTVGSEIEGILRRQYASDTGRTDRSMKPALAHAIQRGRKKAAGDRSLLLPDVFLEFLEQSIFVPFDPAVAATPTGVPLSRHSASHGAARPDTYTRARALQMILAVDQLAFYAL